jgi:alternate signal-mediated exported protein
MNKLTKGAIATAAGVILLMGGAGTLASWNSSATAGTSQSISSGSLGVTSAGSGTWKNAAGTTITPSSYKITPGDTLSYTQTFNLAATGDNLLFTVGASAGAVTAATSGAADLALAAQVNSTASFAVTGSNIAASTSPSTYKVVSNSGTSTVTITMTLQFPYAAATNSSQLGSITLGAGAITLTQTQTA